MEDMFKNAVFGDKYKCKNGQPAIFLEWVYTNINGNETYDFLVLGKYNGALYYRVKYEGNGICHDSMPNPLDDWQIIGKYKDNDTKGSN